MVMQLKRVLKGRQVAQSIISVFLIIQLREPGRSHMCTREF